MKDNKELVCLAKEAMQKSYSPYSNFSVGAALLSKSGKIYSGCNIENASFSPTCCAERTAFFKAVSEGETMFSKIAVVGGKNKEISEFCAPCGVCRQVMREFCDDDFIIVLSNGEEIREYKLSELLPVSFSPKDVR